MIWYLHWLQMRRSVWLAIALLVLSVVVFGLALTRGSRTPGTPEQAAALQAHVASLPVVAVLAALFLSGNGLRARGGGNSTIYSLGLPLGRKQLLGSRLFAGYALLAVTLAALLCANAGVLAFLQKPIPWFEMARISGLAFLSVSPTMAATALTRLYLDDQWAVAPVWILSYMAFRAFGLANSQPVWSNASSAWMLSLLAAAATALLLALTFHFGQRKEF